MWCIILANKKSYKIRYRLISIRISMGIMHKLLYFFIRKQLSKIIIYNLVRNRFYWCKYPIANY